ncbi:glucose dehydrogenase [FAD, quinone]-like [Belonocnema kinseyi]|uniref:glucose dehydrogenase [FAD, quinone]-like n=1 Tax=Belonocnema kinseyi TaxID=2817044 RepID=UPI00143D7CFB|nr:glucose dehydrogenase [FAD, quinone]-like [Belonocnema kinseyi]
MTRRVTFILALVLEIVFVVCQRSSNQQSHRNLYGNQDQTPFLEHLMSLAAGTIKFLQEGERYLNNELTDITPEQNDAYDFIIVGAGSAGATIASRLSEIKNFTVLLIEAGRSENLLMDIPLLVNLLQFSNDINWKYRTESSDKYCLGMNDRRCNWPRGKVMGGSSVLNYMVATRGDPRDYDNWASLGNEGWSYNKLLHYFKKLESLNIPAYRNDTVFHNTKGPVNIEYPTYHTPLADGFLKAGLEMGYPLIDYNGKEHVGFSYIHATLKNGERASTNRAYLHIAKKRSNLFLTRNSMAEKIIIDPKTKRAVGVQFNKENVSIKVRARKEVILCAGAIGSPQLLMLSGIGPKDHLEDVGIPLIKDAPVGENLMDHIAYGGLIFLVDQPVSILPADVTNPLQPYIRQYFNNRDGPLTVPGCVEALAFVDVDRPRDTESYPNVELMFISNSVIAGAGFIQNVGITESIWQELFRKKEGQHSWSIFPMLLRPKSRGRILLKDNLPLSKPRIIPNYFDHPEDIRIIVEAIRASIEVSKTRGMQRFGSHLLELPIRGCENFPHGSDEYWECAARTFTFTIYHHSGTCKMGPEHDPTAVVNPRLQVIGIKGLRVADASIMPEIITGHTNIPVIMIAEKAADIVKEDWGYPIDV